LERLKILSVGAGFSRKFYSQRDRWWKKPFGWGFGTRWGRSKFINMLLNLQAETANNMAGLLLNSEQILRINFESDRNLPLDDPNMLPDLVSTADKDFTYNSSRIRKFIEIEVSSKTVK
jgi:hypothetical protein